MYWKQVVAPQGSILESFLVYINLLAKDLNLKIKILQTIHHIKYSLNPVRKNKSKKSYFLG